MENDAAIEGLLGEICAAVEALHPGFPAHIEMDRVGDEVWVKVSGRQGGEAVICRSGSTVRLAIAALHREVLVKCHEMWERMDPIVRKGVAIDASERAGAE